MDLQDFIEEKKINKIIFSKNVLNLENIVNKKFKFNDVLSNNIIYFGVYSKEDIDILNSLGGNKYILFKNADVDILFSDKELKEEFDKIDNKYILCSSENICCRLKYYGYYDYINIKINLVDNEIFKSVENRGNSIFINNGFNNNKPHYYGKKIIDELVKRNPNYNYIYSNEMDISYDKMIEIYKKCFIGLRVSNGEGLFLMENEMYSMGIKTINNNSVNGLKWKNVEDIETIIKNEKYLLEKKDKKISIVMAYYNRKPQTLETLKGFQEMYAEKYNFEVIIVDDNSNDENRLEEDIKQFSFYINLIVISSEEKGNRINPCMAYNRGFMEADGDIIIIQNPECFHVKDILNYTLNNLKEQDYYSYSCFSPNNFELSNELISSNNIEILINDDNFLKRNIQDTGTQMNWFNHPTDTSHGGRQTFFHFCSAIYKSKLELIGGFDKNYEDGYCFDDDQFILTIKYNLKLNMKIIEPIECFVIHQYHTKNNSFCINSKNKDNEIKQKWLKNKNLYEQNKKIHENNFNYPKLLFLYWDGSALSYLNYLTIVSFNKYNPGWKIIVFTPTHKTDIITWKSHEQKKRYSGVDYFYKIYDIINVIFIKISLDNIGFYNSASEVIKSDYFRYYILEKHGGLWSDFDIIYTNSIEKNMNFEENTIIFNCTSYQFPKNKKEGHKYNYYPIGLFLCKPNNKFFGYIKKNCLKNYDPDEYQSIGAVMFDKLFPKFENVYEIDNVKICDYKYYLPWAWNELYEFYEKEYLDNKLPCNNIGIHWFNGADKSKEYANSLNERIGNFKNECYLDTKINEFINPNDYNIKKISIVIAYFNRKEQLISTLKSNEKSKYPNKEIIIVDDNSREDQRVNLFINNFNKKLNIKVININKDEKTWVNPCIPYNLGIKNATGDIIVIQNPEVIHIGDCLTFINKNLNKKDWLTFNCYGSPSFKFNKDIEGKKDIYNEINNLFFNIGGNSVVNDDVGGWLNHFENHFVAYHYLAAIHKEDIDIYLKTLFNEEFKNGIGSDDDELIKKLIYNNFNFKISRFEKDKPFCVHLYHEKPEAVKKLDYRENKKFFIESCINMNMKPENDIALAPKNEIPMYKRILI